MKKLLLLWLTICHLVFGGQEITVLAPATPASIPVIIAARQQDWKVKIFHNHSRAHSLFLNDKAQILITGLSVGKKFYEQEIPIKILNSYVSGLSYLVSSADSVRSFKELKDKTIYLPFKGSPLEEITRFFALQEKLQWEADIQPKYAPFPSTVNMLLNNKINYAALPEPHVSKLIEANSDIKISLSYYKLWNYYTPEEDGYPQVAAFIKSDHQPDLSFLENFNQALQEGIDFTRNYPDSAIGIAGSQLKFPPKILKASLTRTRFTIYTEAKLKDEIHSYYQILGKPLDETYQDFFLDY